MTNARGNSVALFLLLLLFFFLVIYLLVFYFLFFFLGISADCIKITRRFYVNDIV